MIVSFISVFQLTIFMFVHQMAPFSYSKHPASFHSLWLKKKSIIFSTVTV